MGGRKQLIKKILSPHFSSFLVLINGLFLIFYIPINQFTHHHLRNNISSYSSEMNLIIGFSMLFIASVLRRGKRNAFILTTIFYIGTIIYNIHRQYFTHLRHHHWYTLLLVIVLPTFILIVISIGYNSYSAKSDIKSFKSSVLFSLLFIGLVFIYGVVGFNVLDSTNFHQEISIIDSIHYTVDQLGITTSTNLKAYTPEGRIFLDSLNTATILALIYVLLAFLSPLRFIFNDLDLDRERFTHLLSNDPNVNSEDFFMIWPRDKQYFFELSGLSGLAYRVDRGVALVIGGPIGNSKYFNKLLKQFLDFCYSNDWLPCFFQVQTSQLKMLKKYDFSFQKLGEEAVVHLDTFESNTLKDKYFRNITNRFDKKRYISEYHKPPHSEALISRLNVISEEWLSRGKDERGFAMGYFTSEYMNISDLLVARDEAGTIQAFLNIIPADFDKTEATYDLLRFSSTALPNVNDFLIIELIKRLRQDGYQTLNLGLCPLAGIEEDDSKTGGIIASTMKIVYSNIERLYSFNGLYRFKSKYKPIWRTRYIAYRGGIRGFTKSTNALLKTMKRSVKKSNK